MLQAELTTALAPYVKTTAMNTALSGKAALQHTHVISEVTGLQSALNSKWVWNASQVAGVKVSNAFAADKLASPVKINGTDFNGESDIVTARWGSARTITVWDFYNANKQAAQGIDGSADFSLKLPQSIKVKALNIDGVTLSVVGGRLHVDSTLTADGDLVAYGDGEGSSSAGGLDIARLWEVIDVSHLPSDVVLQAELTTALAPYVKTTAMNTALSGKAALQHTHVISDVTGLVTALESKWEWDEDRVAGVKVSNAFAADKLASSVRINGTPFNGESDIVTARWGSARTITVWDFYNANKQAAQGIDGSADFALKLPQSIKVKTLNIDGVTLSVVGGRLHVDSTLTASGDLVAYGDEEGSSSAGGLDIARLWEELEADDTSKVIDVSHIPGSVVLQDDLTDALAPYVKTTAMNTALAGKAALQHTHAISEVSGLLTALDSKWEWNATQVAGVKVSNAFAADKLTSSVRINGTPFNGESDIVTARWGAARSITVTDNFGANSWTGSGIDGSENIKLYLPKSIKVEKLNIGGVILSVVGGRLHVDGTLTASGDLVAYGDEEGSSGGGLDEEAMWKALGGSMENKKISASYLPDLPKATASVLGGVKLRYDSVQTTAAQAATTTPGRTYGVQVDSSGRLVVNVPWEDYSSADLIMWDYQTTLEGKIDAMDSAIAGKAASSHEHQLSEIKGFGNGWAAALTAAKPSWLTSIPVATDSVLGGIKTGFSEVDRSYAVRIGSGNRAYVLVPWTDTDTKNTAGASNTSAKLFLVGVQSQGGTPVSYTHDTAYIGTDGCLYSGGAKVLTSVSLSTISDLHSSWDALLKAAPSAYVTRWPTAAEVGALTQSAADGRYARKDGSNATGTWPISISGNAASADISNYLFLNPNNGTHASQNDAVPANGRFAIYDVNTATTAGGSDGYIMAFRWPSGNFATQVFLDADSTGIMGLRHRSNSNVWTDWYRILHSGNIGSYALTPSNYASTLDSRYVKKAGDTMTGALTIDVPSTTPLVIDGASTQTYINVKRNGTQKAAFGYYDSRGTFMYNWVNGYYFVLTDGGGLRLHNSGTLVGNIRHSGNDGSGSGLDADLLDGTHKSGLLTALTSNATTNLSLTVGGTVKTVTDLYATYLEGQTLAGTRRGMSFLTSSFSAAGWYRVFTSTGANTSYASEVLLHIGRNYTSPQNENYSFSICVGYNGDISITQLSGVMGGHLITKIRVVWDNSKIFHIDIYSAASSYSNNYGVTGQGYGTFSAFTPNAAIPDGYTAYEFATVDGCKSDRGFSGALSGNATSATKLQTSRTLWGRPFDGTGTGNITPSAAGSYNIGTASLWYERIYGRYIDTASGYNLRLCTGGVEHLSIQASSGNVGIGTTAPAYKLDVAGTLRATGRITAAGLTSSASITANAGITTTTLSASGAVTLSSTLTAAGLVKASAGVQIGSTSDYGWYITNSRIVAGQSTARGVNVGSLLVSSAWADYTKVPTNGIYCKGNMQVARIGVGSSPNSNYAICTNGDAYLYNTIHTGDIHAQGDIDCNSLSATRLYIPSADGNNKYYIRIE